MLHIEVLESPTHAEASSEKAMQSDISHRDDIPDEEIEHPPLIS